MKLELWSQDLFDRDAAPRLESSWDNVRDGLLALWRITLREGVLDDGRPTFHAFTLRGLGAPVSLPRDPLKNPELAMLRKRAEESGFLLRAVELHAQHLDAPFDFAPYLALPFDLPREVLRVEGVLSQALALGDGLRITARGWVRGPDDGPRVRITCDGSNAGSSYFSATTDWSVTAEGLLAGGAPVRFAVHLEDVEWAGWGLTVDSDGSAGAQTLRDALLAAGVAFS